MGNAAMSNELDHDICIPWDTAPSTPQKEQEQATQIEDKRAKQREKEERRRDRELSRRIAAQREQLEAEGFKITPETCILTDDEEDSEEELIEGAEDWEAFKPAPNHKAIAHGLDILPSDWVLTPLRDKKPYRVKWQGEEPVSRDFIRAEILKGESKLSKKTGRPFKLYSSGYGLRTGEISEGILAIDIDGSSVKPLLESMSNGDLPSTISYKSGKPGRFQILYQIPDSHRDIVHQFTKVNITEFGELKCAEKEQLEFRYNRMQSCLPPSRHPETGSYKWINSPEDYEVAIAPRWLLDYLPKLVEKEKAEQKNKQQKQPKKEHYQSNSLEYQNPEDNPYDPRFLIKFCEGYHVKNSDWLAARCPVHKGNSEDSLTVRRDNGAYQCFRNCCTKEIKKTLIQLAKDNGVVFPKTQKAKKDKQKTPEQLAQEAAQFEVEKAIHQELTELNLDGLRSEYPNLKIKIVEKEKLSPQDLELSKGKISIIVSYKGSGKTEALKPESKKFSAIYSWHNRVTLAVKMAFDLGLLYKDDLDNNSLPTHVSFCANSGYRFHPKVLQSNGLLLFDEFDQVQDFIFERLCNKDGIRPILFNSHIAQLNAALKNGSAAYLSADINRKEIDYIMAIAPANTEIELVVNTHQPVKGKLYFSTDNELDAVVAQLEKDLENGIPCFLIDDVKNGYRGAKSIAQYIREKHPEYADKIIEINSDTSELKETKNYIANINEASRNTMLLACTPSVIGGISLTNGRFDNGVYGFFNGILIPSYGAQGLGRVRGAKHTTVWVAKSGFNYEASGAITPAEVNNFYQNNYQIRNKFLQSYQPQYNPMTEEWESPHWHLFCKNAALNNLEMRKLRYWYKEKLIKDGYQLEEKEFGANPTVKDKLKEIWGTIQLAEIHELGEAKLISKAEADSYIAKSDAGITLSKDERLQLAKYHLIDTFGDEIIRDAKATTPSKEELHGIEAIAFLNWGNKLEKQLFKYFRNFHQEPEAIASSDLYIENLQAKKKRADLPGAGARFPKDIKWQLRERKLFDYLEFKKYLEPEKEYYPKDYQPLIDKVRGRVAEIKQVTGYNFERASDGAIISYLYGMLGLSVDASQITVNDKRVRVKKITQNSWEFAQKFVAHQLAKLATKQHCTDPRDLLVNGQNTLGSVQWVKPLPAIQQMDLFSQSAHTHPQQDKGGSVQLEGGVCAARRGVTTTYNVAHPNGEKINPVLSPEEYDVPRVFWVNPTTQNIDDAGIDF